MFRGDYPHGGAERKRLIENGTLRPVGTMPAPRYPGRPLNGDELAAAGFSTAAANKRGKLPWHYFQTFGHVRGEPA